MKSKNLLFIAALSLFISWSNLHGQETPQELPEGFENLIEDSLRTGLSSSVDRELFEILLLRPIIFIMLFAIKFIKKTTG